MYISSWALVKDQDVARKMTKFIELNTIGVSKDSQLRAAKVLKAVSDGSAHVGSSEVDSFFEFSYYFMSERWKQLRKAVEQSGSLSLPQYPPAFCTFWNRISEPHPGNTTHVYSFDA